MWDGASRLSGRSGEREKRGRSRRQRVQTALSANADVRKMGNEGNRNAILSKITRGLSISWSETPEGRKALFSFLRFVPDPLSGRFGRKLQIVPKVFRQVEIFYVTIDEQNRGNGLFGKIFEATSGDGPTGIVPRIKPGNASVNILPGQSRHIMDQDMLGRC
jgi:hypothetical protein